MSRSKPVILDGPKLRSTAFILEGKKWWSTSVIFYGLKLRFTTVIFESWKWRSTTVILDWPKIRPTTVILDRPIGRWSKFSDVCRPFGRYVYIILDPYKWTAPHRRNGLCLNVRMWAVQLDEDPKLCSTTVILDRSNGRSSKFTLIQRNFGRPNYAIWTKEPIW